MAIKAFRFVALAQWKETTIAARTQEDVGQAVLPAVRGCASFVLMARVLRPSLAFLATAVMVATAPPACAADWPARPVTVVGPFGRGGNTDVMARLAAAHLKQDFESFAAAIKAAGIEPAK